MLYIRVSDLGNGDLLAKNGILTAVAEFYLVTETAIRNGYVRMKTRHKYWDWRILNDIEISLRISGIAVVSSIAIPETVSLSSLQFQVSHNTTSDYWEYREYSLRTARYRRYSWYLRRLTVFCTATIYRGISWPWRYWYRHVGIDDKYRGVVGIAQH